MGHPRHYSLLTKARFYLAYFFHKLMVPLEVQRPRLRLSAYEAMYTACKFLDYESQLGYPFRDETIETRFGKFAIQKGTSDAAGVSPAYERSDVNYLHKLIGGQLAKGRRVMFLDVGADIGVYSATLLNTFPNSELKVMAFEPTARSFALLCRNLTLNGHKEGDRLKIFNCALGSKANGRAQLHFDALAPGSSRIVFEPAAENAVEIEVQSLDQLVSPALDSCDDIFMKIDVEGMEIPVLQGAQQIMASGRGLYLMVEDFVDGSILEYIHSSTKLKFLAKRTAYNSWWYSE